MAEDLRQQHELWLEENEAKIEKNPMRRRAGPGPEGKICAECFHLMIVDYHDKRYFKCGLRGDTRGAGTDHRKKWLACSHFAAEISGKIAGKN